MKSAYYLENKKIILERAESKMQFSDYLSCIYFAICFWEPYLNTLIGSVTKYFLLVIIAVMLFEKKYISLKWIHLGVVGWAVLRALTVFEVGVNEIVETSWMSLVGMVLYFVVITGSRHCEQFIDYLIYSCWISSSLVCIASLFFSQPYRENYSTRMVLTIMGAQVDPNNEAGLKLFAFIISVVFIVIKQKFKWIYILMTIISVYAILLTGSRGGFLGFVTAGIAILFCLANKVSALKKIGIVILSGVLLFLILYVVKSYLDPDIFNRLFDTKSYGNGSNRTEIWSTYIPLFYHNVLFGSGWGSYWGYGGKYTVCHNTFLDVLTETGIFGLLFLMTPIFVLMGKNFKYKNTIAFALLTSEMVVSFFISSLGKRTFWLPIIISALTFFSEEKNLNQNDKLTGD